MQMGMLFTATSALIIVLITLAPSITFGGTKRAYSGLGVDSKMLEMDDQTVQFSYLLSLLCIEFNHRLH